MRNWIPLTRAAGCLAQRLDFRRKQIAAAVEEICCEKPTSAWHKRATIIGHVGTSTERTRQAIDGAHASIVWIVFL
jgi:hypothetical protein